MSFSRFLIGLAVAMLALVVTVPTALAEPFQIEKGANYDREFLGLSEEGGLLFKWTSAPERILTGTDQWGKPIYDSKKVTEDAYNITVETQYGSVVLNKQYCAFSFYPKGFIQPGQQPLFTDSIVAKRAPSGTENWQAVNSVNNAACEATLDGSTLSAKKQAAAGILDYRYIFTGTSWKTELAATNLSSLTDQKFGFTQTIDMNRDHILFGGQERNLDNFNATTFNRTWLENNESKVLDFLNGVNFDFDLAFDNLSSVTVYDTGPDSSKLAFNFLHDAQVLPSGETFIIDPVFEYDTAGTSDFIVPDGVETILAKVWGAGGQNNTSNPNLRGGGGGFAQATIPVIPGSTLKVVVGSPTGGGAAGGGATCINAGAGGGYSGIFNNSVSHANALIVGGAGGGAGGICQETSSGGQGGGMGATAARSGTNSTGGTGQVGGCGTGQNGAALTGGAGASCGSTDSHKGGGGGAGYYGGGGGSSTLQFGGAATGGGGGSNNATIYASSKTFMRGVIGGVSTGGTAANPNDPYRPAEAGTAGHPGAVVIVYSVPPIEMSCEGIPFGGQCAWTPDGGSGIDDYYIATSIDGVNYANTTFIGNVTSHTFSGLTPAQTYWARVNATVTGILNATGAVAQFTVDTIPSAPQDASATGRSDTSIIIRWHPPSSDGGDAITGYRIDYSLECETGWTLLVNETNTLNYNHTGVPSGDTYCYRLAAWNGVGISPFTGNFTGTPFAATTGSVTLSDGVVGDVIQLNGTVTITAGAPEPINISQSRFYVDGSLEETRAEDIDIDVGNSDTLDPFWYQFTDGSNMVFSIQVTAANSTGTVTLVSAANVTESREYDPDYTTAIDPAEGFVNYTTSRSSDQDTVLIRINRDQGGATFQVECLLQTQSQAAISTTVGTWKNQSTVGYYNASISGFAGQPLYGTCYNDGELLTFQNYGNGSLVLFGIQIFDDTYGAYLGVPVGVFFIVMLAGAASQRTAPTWIVILLAVAGVMATIGFFGLDDGTWALALVAGLLGLLVGRKFF